MSALAGLGGLFLVNFVTARLIAIGFVADVMLRRWASVDTGSSLAAISALTAGVVRAFLCQALSRLKPSLRVNCNVIWLYQKPVHIAVRLIVMEVGAVMRQNKPNF